MPAPVVGSVQVFGALQAAPCVAPRGLAFRTRGNSFTWFSPGHVKLACWWLYLLIEAKF